MSVKVTGKGNICATVVADSISAAGVRITTFELEYHRFIHAEAKTHRAISMDDSDVFIVERNDSLMSDPMLSRNAASSRAIPVEKVIEQVENNPAMPIHWGKNQPGMKAAVEVDNVAMAKLEWQDAACSAVDDAAELVERGLHKQIVNRILEPYQFIKVVCTATEYENFFYLRDHADAQPEIAELARCMREAREMSTPEVLFAGDWHTPYVSHKCGGKEHITYVCGGEPVSLEDALKLSASLCAQVSYRKSDESIEKALKIYDMLVNMKPVHASPFEHQATPMETHIMEEGWYLGAGVTHCDVSGNLWSGNFKGWIQNRQLIKGHVYGN